MAAPNDVKCLFAITEYKEAVLIGIPEKGWEYIKNGDKTHTFDLTSLGIPVKIVLFGCRDVEHGKSLLNMDRDTLDLSGIDFGFDQLRPR